MGVVTLLKGSSSSKLAGELQGIVKSEPVQVTTKAESFGRAMDSARRIVESSETPKSSKSNDKKKSSGKKDAPASDAKTAELKTAKNAEVAKDETKAEGKKVPGKVTLTRADSAAYEAKAVAQEPTRAHNVAESVKGTLERLAAESKVAKGSKVDSESKKSQKSTNAAKVDAPASTDKQSVNPEQGEEAVAELKSVKTVRGNASVPKESAEAQPSTSGSKRARVADVKDATKPEQAMAAANTDKSVEDKNAGALLEAKRADAIRTKDAVHGESVKTKTTSTQDAAIVLKASAQTGNAQQAVQKPMRDTKAEGKQSKDAGKSNSNAVVKGTAQEAAPNDAGRASIQVEDDELAQDAQEEKQSVSSESGKEQVSPEVEATIVAADVGLVAKPVEQGAALLASDKVSSVTKQMAGAASTDVHVAPKAVEADAVDVAAVKVSKDQMEAKASEHLYRAVNKLASGEGGGVIAIAKSVAKAGGQSDSKKEMLAANGKTQSKDRANASLGTVKTPNVSATASLAEATGALGQSTKQPSKNAGRTSVQPRMTNESAKAKTEVAGKAEAAVDAEVKTRNTKAVVKDVTRTKSGPNMVQGQRLGLGARDSMTVESSLIGNRLFAKRGSENQPTTYRNPKGAAKDLVREDFTTGQKARAAKHVHTARPVTQPAQQPLATDTAAMATTSARSETAATEMPSLKKGSVATATTSAEGNLKGDSVETASAKSDGSGQEQEQGKKQAKRGQEQRHFETKKQVETETRNKEEAMDDLQEASDVEIADEVAQVKQAVAANKVTAKPGGRAVVGALTDLGNTPRDAAAISERREVHEQILAKNLGRNLGRIASMGTTRANLRLHPQEFGRVDVEIRTRDGEVTLLVRTETVSAAAELNSQMNDLRASMKEHGLHLAECDVEARGFGAEDRGADGSEDERDGGDRRGRGEQDNRDGHGSRRRRGRGQRIKRSAIDVVV